ncbi:hypothetical protein EJB05_08892, partial [Eragrostis curvula]
MAPSPPPPPMPTTASRCAVDSSRGAHVFEVADYSLHLGLGVGRFIRSATFDVGGYDWCIRFYPDGYSDEYKDYFAVAIELLTADAVVSGSYRFARSKMPALSFIMASNKMDDVVKTQGYAGLKRSCPSVLGETIAPPLGEADAPVLQLH